MGLYLKGMTYRLTYLKEKEEVFNVRRVPKKATDRERWAQVPTPFLTVGSEDPREGASRA